ncbi:MAG: tetratricopeptide repeat protein [Bacteroidota bacterium]
MAKKKAPLRSAQSTPVIAAPQKWYEKTRLIAVALAVLCVGLYANTLGHGYVLDDAIVLTENSTVKKGLAGWGELFGNDTFYGFFGENKMLVEGGRYRPLTPAMFGLEREVFGTNPFTHHFFNLLWYTGLVLLIYFFFVQVARHRGWSLAVPLVIALVFAAHPVHTEAVANIKGRDEIVALCGAMGAAFMVWKAAFRAHWQYSFYAGLFLFGGLLAKENTITFLAVLPVWLYVLKADFRWSDLRYLGGPLFFGSLFLLLRFIVLTPEPGTPVVEGPIMEYMNNPFLKVEDNRWVPFSTSERLATVSATLGEYLRLLVFPLRLSHDYYPPSIEVSSWGDLRAIGSLFLYLLLLAGGILLAWRKKLAGAGILTYLICLSIVSNIFFPIGTLMSERFLFMPSLGFAMLVGAGYQWLQASSYRALAWPLIIGLVTLLSLRTVVRNPVWINNFTLFTTDVEIQPNSAKLQNAAGGVKIDEFRTLAIQQQATRQDLLTEARAHLSKAIELHPTYKNAFFLRGRAALLQEDYSAAITDYEHALRLDPNYQLVEEDLLIALPKAAMEAGQRLGNLALARQHLNRALNLNPNHYQSVRLMGVVSGVGGDPQGAIEWFARAAEIEPENAGAWYDLGTAYYQAGQEDQGLQFIERARQMDPNIDVVRREAN